MKDSPTLELSPYQKQMHFLGRVSSLIAVFAMLMVPILLTFLTQIPVDFGGAFRSFFGVFAMFGVFIIVEFVSYAPILGSGALYLSFITGNTLNLKMPAALSSVSLAGVEPNSEGSEVVSTIAVAISSIVTVIILFIGMVGLSFIVPILQSPVLKPAFDNLMPALMGALGTPYLLGDFRTASLPAVLAIALTLVLGFTVFSQLQALLLPGFILITIGWRYILYRKDKKTAVTAAV